MAVARRPVDPLAELPDPGQAGTLDDLVERLRRLKVWAGDPSYGWITDQVNTAWRAAGRPAGELAGKTTVVDCFRAGRRRLNSDLVTAVVRALHPDVGYVTQWRQALRVVGGRTRAAAQVRVQDRLPQELDGFVGRSAELGRLLDALGGATGSGVAVISAITGMAGVGKTQLALRAGHQLARDAPFDRVLFVNLRGFHPDPVQPPADPTAVLDGFLRLLGVPGHQVPHDRPGRVAAYRERLAGTRTLVLLDNAADEAQVRPLLPDTPGCPALVTSRRSLAGLGAATHVTVDVFSADEAEALLTLAATNGRVRPDPDAAARIARRCGYLPLALGLVTGHMRAKPGWTLADHADRLDERQQDRQLDAGVEVALDLSYRHLPPGGQRLLRLAALHPGQDLDAYAAAALCGLDLASARGALERLREDHLLQRVAADRYTQHDLVRVYASARASDDDRPTDRRAALTRLFDHYLATAAAAMDILHPAEAHRRPPVDPPASPAPPLADADAARAWLDTERPTLVAVAAHTAAHGWPRHTTRLSLILFRYLVDGHLADALAVQEHARRAARLSGDPAEEAHALTNLGATEVRLGRYDAAAEHLQQALARYETAGTPAGRARALINLGVVEERRGRFPSAAGHYARALELHRAAGDPTGEARALGNLGIIETRLHRYEPAAVHLRAALVLSRKAGDRTGEASHLNNLGDVEGRLGRLASAADHLQEALALYRSLANRAGEAGTLDSLGGLHVRLGEPDRAAGYYHEALEIVRATGEPQGEACALNGLGEAATAAGRRADAVAYHAAAHAIAVDIGDRYEQARAHAGLGRGEPDAARARHHHERALALYTDLGVPPAADVAAAPP